MVLKFHSNLNNLNFIENEKYNNVFFITASLCNSLLIDSSKVQGDSLEKALYLYSLDKGYNKDNLLKDYKFINEQRTKQYKSLNLKDETKTYDYQNDSIVSKTKTISFNDFLNGKEL